MDVEREFGKHNVKLKVTVPDDAVWDEGRRLFYSEKHTRDLTDTDSQRFLGKRQYGAHPVARVPLQHVVETIKSQDFLVADFLQTRRLMREGPKPHDISYAPLVFDPERVFRYRNGGEARIRPEVLQRFSQLPLAGFFIVAYKPGKQLPMTDLTTITLTDYGVWPVHWGNKQPGTFEHRYEGGGTLLRVDGAPKHAPAILESLAGLYWKSAR